RSDSDYPKRMIVEQDLLADQIGIAAKPALPTTVADNRNRMRELCSILVGGKCAPLERVHSEYVEVVAGDQVAPHAFVVAVTTQADRREALDDEPGENIISIPQVDIVRIGQCRHRIVLGADSDSHDL